MSGVEVKACRSSASRSEDNAASFVSLAGLSLHDITLLESPKTIALVRSSKFADLFLGPLLASLHILNNF
jgi:hypothetical protein